MKKILGIVLAIAMLVPMAFTVSAVDINTVLTGIANPYPLELTVDVAARNGSVGEYSTSDINATITSGSSANIDYKSTLYMAPVRNLFALAQASLSSDESTAFDSGVITTEVVVTITYPSAASISGDLNTIGSLNAGMTFNEVSRVISGNTVTITYQNESGLTVGALRPSYDTLLADIYFVLDGAVSYNAAGSYDVTVDMTGDTTIAYAGEYGTRTQVIEYNVDPAATHTTNITVTSAPAGPGGGGVASYTITYETNGGNKLSPERYSSGTTVQLTKVPVKEGYIFEGWYLDEALTEEVTELKMTKNIVLYAAWVEDNGSAGSAHEIPEMLNGEDHFAYIVGYPDGTVRPNANITRAEVTSIFFRLLKDEVREQNLTTENNFSDVNEGDWYNTAISTMAKLGIINGRDEETFVPNTPITRAEFAVICARFDDSEYEITDNFTDVVGHWAEEEIHEAAAYGWIRGYEDNTFKPDQLITRAEAMTMINRIVKRTPETVHDMLDSMTIWPDNSDEDVWYYIPVQEATNGHEHDMKNHIYETWTDSKDSHDWTKYE